MSGSERAGRSSRETDDRVQDALAAHVEHLEVGGPEPDVSHLTPAELERLRELIGLLEQTEGVAFGRGLEGERESRSWREAASSEVETTTPEGKRLVGALRDALPAIARISSDPTAVTFAVPGMAVTEGWVVGTFGGRVRVWLLADEGALGGSDAWLRHLDRVFRLLPDTAALTLVEPDLSALLVQPEDCAPTIEVPGGSLVGRRFRRPVHPVGEVLSAFVRELTPYWEPMGDIGGGGTGAIDVPPVAREVADRAITEQAATGRRARTTAKKDALTALGERQASRLAELLLEVHEGRVEPDDVSEALRRLARER